jgi:hypothetical protein
VFGCGTVVHYETVGMVRGDGLPSGGGVVAMETVRVSTLQP